MNWDEERCRTIAGQILIASGAIAVLGIVTAEALYPGYSTGHETISQLGSTASGEIVPAAAAVFNGAMVLTGLFVLVAAYCLWRSSVSRVIPPIVTVTGLGVVGVGVFPMNVPLPHTIASLLAFGGGGIAAIVSATLTKSPFRLASIVFGTVALVALVLFVSLGDANPIGIGGIERWVAYPILLWVVGFGGYLLGQLDPVETGG